MKNKKNITIFILSIVIFIMTVIIFYLLIFYVKNTNLISVNNNSIDGSHMNSLELLEMFEKENYNIKIEKFISSSYSDNSVFIILENKTEGIRIQRILNTLVGTLMTYSEHNINKESADLLELSENDTKEKEQQYKAFLSWLKKYNITKSQLSEMLDKYYSNNPNKIEITNIDELLSK